MDKIDQIMNEFLELYCQQTNKYKVFDWLKFNLIELQKNTRIQTKKEVIGEYYKMFSSTDKKYCEHESDGYILLSNPPQNRCKKCGKIF